MPRAHRPPRSRTRPGARRRSDPPRGPTRNVQPRCGGDLAGAHDGAELVLSALNPRDMRAFRDDAFGLVAVRRDSDEKQHLRREAFGGSQGAQRAEREAREDEGTIRLPGFQPASRRDDVLRFAGAAVVRPRGPAHTPEMEAERRERESSGQEARGAVHDFRAHRSPEPGMRVRHERRPGRSRRRTQERLQGARGTRNLERRELHGGRVPHRNDVSTRPFSDAPVEFHRPGRL